MKNLSVEQSYRRFLMAVAAFIFVGTALELILLEHYLKALQFTPYILSGLGLGTLIAVWFYPARKSVLALRWMMAAVAVGSLFGMWQHFTGNLVFVREINPSFTLIEALWPAIKGGNPLLAPGILFLAGVLGGAATYRHPAIEK